jgi:propionate CoA-transferase
VSTLSQRISEKLGAEIVAGKPTPGAEGFVLERDVEDAYVEMVKDVVERYYLGVTRFTTSSFMRAKL